MKNSGLSNFIVKDFLLKLFSVIISVILWFIVINIENPVETRSFSVNLSIINSEVITDSGKIISNYNQIEGSKVNIRVTATRLALDSLTQNSEKIIAAADLTTIGTNQQTGEFGVPIIVTLPPDLGESYTIESTVPSTLTFSVENRVVKEMPVELEILNPDPTLPNPVITPETVSVSGRESLVNSVSVVKAQLDGESITEDSYYSVFLTPYNSEGTEVTGINLNTTAVDVYVPPRASKRVSISAEITGFPEVGYAYDSISVQPEFVYVLGEDSDLFGFTEIVVPPIDLTDKNESFSTTFSVNSLLPEGLSVKEGEGSNITVSVSIIPDSIRTAIVKQGNIAIVNDLPENLIATVDANDLAIQIRGSEKDLDLIEEDDLRGVLVISADEVGEYRLPVTIQLPENIRMTEGESPYITVVITEVVEEESETPDLENEEGTENSEESETLEGAEEESVPLPENSEDALEAEEGTIVNSTVNSTVDSEEE